jgi:putative RecB family exonuclease
VAVAITHGRSSGSFSPTALMSWQACPQQWAFRYRSDERPPSMPSPARILGRALHSALAFLFSISPDARSVEVAQGALRHFWRIERSDDAFADRDAEVQWGQRGLDALAWFCSNYDLGVRPIAGEEWIRATLLNGRVIAGRADRIDQTGSGDGIEVVDYKSGRCWTAPDGLRHDTAAQVYALAAARMLRRPVAAVRFIYLTEQVERSWQPTGAEMAEVEERLVELTDEIAAAGSFEPRPGRQCEFCDYRTICPATRPSVEALVDPGEVVF